MRFSHIVKRGKYYHYVQRVPQDLLQHFPKPSIWKSLKTTDAKAAQVLAAGQEQRTQQLFFQLRSNMLSKELEQRIVASYLQHGADRIESAAMGEKYAPNLKELSPVDKVITKATKQDAVSNLMQEAKVRLAGWTVEDAVNNRTEYLQLVNDAIQDRLKHRQAFVVSDLVDSIADALKKELRLNLTDREHKRLSIQLTDATLQLNNAEEAAISGDWSLLKSLQDRVAASVQTPYASFSDIVDRYLVSYMADRPDNRPGTKADVEVECRVLKEFVGRRSIEEVNTLDMVASIKTMLRKYPKNRLQRYGDKSIHTILKSESGYETISPKTANQYIARMTAIVDYAVENRTLSTANVWKGKRFKITALPEEERLPYDKQDIERLVDALCTKPLWRYNQPKPERFWVVMIALLQGFRLGNITGLHKEHIVDSDGISCFDLVAFGSKGVKRAATAQLVPVHPVLAELGFLKWVDSLDRGKLFQDSADQLSKWYNRKDKHGEGFEPAYVTKDPLKCLYSTRHVFAGDIYASTKDMKLVKDSLGHASDKRNVTSRYTGRAKIEAILSAMESMQLEGVDVVRLKQRAAELFGV